MAAEQEQGRCVLDRHRPPQARLEGVAVVGHLAQVLDVPAVGLEAPGGVVGEGQLGAAVDGDAVVVVDVDEAAEAQVAGEGRRLVGDPLGEVAVAADHEGVVVAELGAEPGPQPRLGHPHPHAVGDALAQGTGRDLDPGRVVALGVARRHAAELAEVLQVRQRQPVTGQVQHRVEQDRGVPRREDEAVPVGPVGGGGVVGHHPGPQDVGQWRQGHGRARMPGVGRLRSVHRQPADDVDRVFLEGHPSLPSHVPPTLSTRPASQKPSADEVLVPWGLALGSPALSGTAPPRR